MSVDGSDSVSCLIITTKEFSDKLIDKLMEKHAIMFQDWMEMLQSKDKKRFEASCCVNFEFATSEATGPDSLVDGSNEVRPDPKAFLYPYVLDVFFNLHLVYEVLRLHAHSE